jgi:hypothetical protein
MNSRREENLVRWAYLIIPVVREELETEDVETEHGMSLMHDQHDRTWNSQA